MRQRRGAEDPGTLAEFDSRSAQMDEEYFDFIAPTGYVPHLNELRPIIDAAEKASGGTVAGFAQAASNLIHDLFQLCDGRDSRAFID